MDCLISEKRKRHLYRKTNRIDLGAVKESCREAKDNLESDHN